MDQVLPAADASGEHLDVWATLKIGNRFVQVTAQVLADVADALDGDLDTFERVSAKAGLDCRLDTLRELWTRFTLPSAPHGHRKRFGRVSTHPLDPRPAISIPSSSYRDVDQKGVVATNLSMLSARASSDSAKARACQPSTRPPT